MESIIHPHEPITYRPCQSPNQVDTPVEIDKGAFGIDRMNARLQADKQAAENGEVADTSSAQEQEAGLY